MLCLAGPLQWVGQLDALSVAKLQFAATTVLAFGSLSIAAVASLFAYRNYFGWKPLIYVAAREGCAGEYDAWIGASFEIWNRRKYPVLLHRVGLRYHGVSLAAVSTEGFDTAGGSSEFTWKVLKGQIECDPDLALEPNERRRFAAFGSVDLSGGPVAFDHAMVQAIYYDPRTTKFELIRADTKHEEHTWSQMQKRWES